jgi:hypothetical protein
VIAAPDAGAAAKVKVPVCSSIVDVLETSVLPTFTIRLEPCTGYVDKVNTLVEPLPTKLSIKGLPISPISFLKRLAKFERDATYLSFGGSK